MVWVFYNRNVFLTALEAGGLTLVCQQGVYEGHTQFADFPFCPHKAEGAEGSCWSLFYKDINLMTALPSSPHHPPQSPHLLIPSLRALGFQHWNSGAIHADQAPTCFGTFYRGSLSPLSAATRGTRGLRAADLEGARTGLERGRGSCTGSGL